ncbi:MAG: hypothetical protein JNK38_19735 [Acidobacteria bacterium]|nr:hypothetical protein [Acidobacteriota bacterium]
MATTTVEQILEEITALPASEQARLRQLINKQLRQKEPLGMFVDPIPEPDQQGAMRWIADHWREYPDQWIALDGYRLIAHGEDFRAVNAAAKKDGAYLPMVTFIERESDHLFVNV